MIVKSTQRNPNNISARSKKTRVLASSIIPEEKGKLKRVLQLRPSLDGGNQFLVMPLLGNTDLRGVDLGYPKREINLTGANLTDTDLTGANLRYINLTGANLTGANLTKSDLRIANLTGANLSNTDLRNANLSGANLTGAK
jgi:uncharacterized protein YjbI with pentapeptide repeats